MDNQAPQTELSKPELVAKLKGLIGDAKSAPIKELCKIGDYENNPDLNTLRQKVSALQMRYFPSFSFSHGLMRKPSLCLMRYSTLQDS